MLLSPFCNPTQSFWECTFHITAEEQEILGINEQPCDSIVTPVVLAGSLLLLSGPLATLHGLCKHLKPLITCACTSKYDVKTSQYNKIR